MTIHAIGVRALGFFAFLAVMLALSPQPTAASHVQSIAVSVASIDSITRTVTVTIAESTVGTGSIHSQAVVQWGDAVTSNQAWTSTSGIAPKVYAVFGVSHIYPDLTDRTITVFSDCCNSFFSTETNIANVQLGCADTALGGCNAGAAKSQFQMKNNTIDNSKDKLKFKWLSGSTTFPAPGQYFLCVYAPGLVLQAIAAGPNFATTGTGFKYKDLTGPNGGLTKVILKSDLTGKAKIIAKGKGANLDDPLPLTQPVLVQLQHSSGQCWDHLFTAPEIKNTADLFKDKEP